MSFRCSKHRSSVPLLLAGQRKTRLGRSILKNSRTQILPDCRAMLEAVTGTAAGEPNIVELRMAIDEEIAIPGVLVLADTGLDNGRGTERWNMFLQVGAQVV